jgi:hypothetical protein
MCDRFQEPDPEPKQDDCNVEKFYCKQCGAEKPDYRMSQEDGLCQTCLDRALERDSSWDIIMHSIRSWVNEALFAKTDGTITTVLYRIKTYLKDK